MAERIQYSVSNLQIQPLAEGTDLSSFSCGNEELDKFFREEITLCQRYKYVSVYGVSDIKTHEILALFTLSNDALIIESEDDLSDFVESETCEVNQEYQEIFGKQSSFPAINIGHLAVRTEKQRMGIGQFVVEYLIATFLHYGMAGCQYITVDSLNNPDTNKFYCRNGFNYQTNCDMNCQTRRMYLSLLKYL